MAKKPKFDASLNFGANRKKKPGRAAGPASLDALAAELLGLSAEDRARLAAMLATTPPKESEGNEQ